jgi:hypothetical protein
MLHLTPPADCSASLLKTYPVPICQFPEFLALTCVEPRRSWQLPAVLVLRPASCFHASEQKGCTSAFLCVDDQSVCLDRQHFDQVRIVLERTKSLSGHVFHEVDIAAVGHEHDEDQRRWTTRIVEPATWQAGTEAATSWTMKHKWSAVKTSIAYVWCAGSGGGVGLCSTPDQFKAGQWFGVRLSSRPCWLVSHCDRSAAACRLFSRGWRCMQVCMLFQLKR